MDNDINLAEQDSSEDARPMSHDSFQRKLDKFREFIAEVTLEDTDFSADEKRHIINEKLRYEYFCDYVRDLFGAEIKSQDLKAIHRKLCSNPEVRIDWSEVFGYFQNENEEDNEEISVFTVSKRKTIGQAAGDKTRRDIIESIVYSKEFDYYITVSQKGAISIYNGKLRLQNCIDVNESAWITGCQYLPRLRKVAVATERSLVVWDHRAKGKNLSNSIYVIKPLEHSPQSMCSVPSDNEFTDSILIGDDAGYVNLYNFTHNDFVVQIDKDQKVMKYHVIDPVSLTIPVVRRRFHYDWVLQLKYLPDLKSFASCSPCEKISFAIASLKRLHDTQPVSTLSLSRGINAFCYSERSNIFATGGVDKVICIWHPNILSRPTGKMIGHLFTIIDIVMNEKDQHVISLSTARVFRVWDIHTLACLQVFTDVEGSGDKRISTMLFDARRDRLMTGSATLDVWPMTRSVQDTMSVPHTHDHPLTAIVLNPVLGQVITICTESIIKVWEVETGRQMYQIMEAHGPNIEVTSSAVSATGTKMITGAYDGSLKVWEFSSGQEIKFYSYTESTDHDDQSVLCLEYIKEANANVVDESDDDDEVFKPEQPATQGVDRVIGLGWSNKIRMFADNDDDSSLILLCEFDYMYELPPTPLPTGSPTDGDVGQTPLLKRGASPRMDNVLILNEMSCCSMLTDIDGDVIQHAFVTGCLNGNLLVWDYSEAKVKNLFNRAKAELASSYESHRNHSKDQFPHRCNGCVSLQHKIFRPDPEEVKKRKKLMRKRMREEGDDEGENEDDKEEKEKPVHLKTQGDADGEGGGAGNDDDPADEVDIDIAESSDDEESGGENSEPDLAALARFGDMEPIKLVEVNFPVVVASCHQDSNIRFWTKDGELLCAITPNMRQLAPLTAICCDQYADMMFAADAKGYVIVWDVSEFLEKSPATLSAVARQELIKQTICWHAHLMKTVDLAFVDATRVLISASIDGSVRMWYPHTGNYIGYFGQHRIWHVTLNPSLPSSPVLPYDITEGPSKHVGNVRSTRGKKQTKKYDYPLVFDAERWRPFRHSAYVRDRAQRVDKPPLIPSNFNVGEIRNKKFFSALVKPKADKSTLEADKPLKHSEQTFFHHLPVYRLQTPPLQPTAIMESMMGVDNVDNASSKVGGGKQISKAAGMAPPGSKMGKISRSYQTKKVISSMASPSIGAVTRR